MATPAHPAARQDPALSEMLRVDEVGSLTLRNPSGVVVMTAPRGVAYEPSAALARELARRYNAAPELAAENARLREALEALVRMDDAHLEFAVRTNEAAICEFCENEVKDAADHHLACVYAKARSALASAKGGRP